jgi:hypothetical protein
VPTYRVRSTSGDDLGLIEHPAPNVEHGGVVQLPDGHDGIVRPHRDHTTSAFRDVYGEDDQVAMRVGAWLSRSFVLPLEALALAVRDQRFQPFVGSP